MGLQHRQLGVVAARQLRRVGGCDDGDDVGPFQDRRSVDAGDPALGDRRGDEHAVGHGVGDVLVGVPGSPGHLLRAVDATQVGAGAGGRAVLDEAHRRDHPDDGADDEPSHERHLVRVVGQWRGGGELGVNGRHHGLLGERAADQGGFGGAGPPRLRRDGTERQPDVGGAVAVHDHRRRERGEAERERRPLADLAVGDAGALDRRRDLDGLDQPARLEDRVTIGAVAGQPVELVEPDCDIQRNVSYCSCANRTGDAQGAPSASAVARVMYELASTVTHARFGIHLVLLPEPQGEPLPGSRRMSWLIGHRGFASPSSAPMAASPSNPAARSTSPASGSCVSGSTLATDTSLGDLTIDVSEVSFLDSTGFSVLGAAHHRLGSQ